MTANIETELVTYLNAVHAIEQHGVELMSEGIERAGDAQIAEIWRVHRLQTEQHVRDIAERLAAHGETGPGRSETPLGLERLAVGFASPAARATPATLVMAAYALENLEIAAYHLLRGIAALAGDQDTVAVADRILEQEEAAAEVTASIFDRALEVSLREPPNPATQA